MIERADRILETLAHLAATRTGGDGAILRHALYAALLASALNLSPADADDRAADPAWSDAERAINDRARELIEQARTTARTTEFALAPRWAPPAERLFAVGDTIRLRITQSASWIDPDLADEECSEDDARARVTARVGDIGRVTVVRSWPAPLPYVVLVGDREISVPEEALERMPVWTPRPGDIVTRTGISGTWVVRRYEDDDTVWVHRPGVRMVPTAARPGGGMVDLATWRQEPLHEELAAVAELRPAEQIAAVTR